MSETPLSPNSDTKCIACKSQIPVDANICHACTSFQAVWKNNCRTLVRVLGAILLVTAFLTYVITTWSQVRRVLLGEDKIEVIAFDPWYRAAFRNSGDSNVFISHVFLKAKHTKSSWIFPINKTVNSGEFLSHGFDDTNKKTDVWRIMPMLEEEWQRSSRNPYIDDRCFRWNFYHVDDPNFRHIKDNLKDELRTLEVEGSIIFFSSLKEEKVSISIPLYGALFKNLISDCKERDS